MVSPSRMRPDPAAILRGLDRAWAERLEAEAARYERLERRSRRRRAGLCLLAAAAVVVLGLVGLGAETNMRLARVYDIKSPGWVTVTLFR